MNTELEKEIIHYEKTEDIYKNKAFQYFTKEFLENMVIYKSAIKEISTKLEILNDEFHAKNEHNPIEHIKSRIKTPTSILEKLEKKGFEKSMRSIRLHLNDIAGIRVICSFIGDIYLVADLLKSQDDITLISEKDYIKNPKQNGYRSLHLVLEIPVFFSDKTERARVEIQIRTIAMDFWASLEHKLYYKSENKKLPDNLPKELKECADIMAAADLKMQSIQTLVRTI